MKALILAAGHGSRLRDHVQVPHKALVEIEGESLLSRTCRMLEQSGLREIVVVTGHRSAELRAALEVGLAASLLLAALRPAPSCSTARPVLRRS